MAPVAQQLPPDGGYGHPHSGGGPGEGEPVVEACLEDPLWDMASCLYSPLALFPMVASLLRAGPPVGIVHSLLRQGNCNVSAKLTGEPQLCEHFACQSTPSYP